MPRASKSAPAQTVSPVLKCRKGDLAIRLDKRFPGQIVEVAEYRPTVKWPSGFAMFDAWEVLHPTYEAGYSYFPLKDLTRSLKDGVNVIAIEAHGSPDGLELQIDPYLILED